MANGKTMQAVVNLAGSIDPSLGKAIEQAQKKISGLNVKALAVGAAVGGIAVATGKAVVEAGKYMKDLGASFDDAADAIRIGTGATGDALDGLLDDFDAVYKSVPTTMEDASKAIADYNTRLGLTGPQLQEMGYSFETASALMGQLDKAGVNTDEVLGAMKKSVATLAKEGISASDGLAMYYEKIKNAGTAAEAASSPHPRRKARREILCFIWAFRSPVLLHPLLSCAAVILLSGQLGYPSGIAAEAASC